MNINLSNTVNNFSSPLTLLKISTKIINGRPIETEEEIKIKGLFKPLQYEKLVLDNVNYSLQYMHYTGTYQIFIGDYIAYNGKKFKCYSVADYGKFGLYKADFEEVEQS